jgi:NAD(P)-dependent dehydrogenase (short-subunit alcohol dehydrogenase family)
MKATMRDTTAVITGAATGIGYATAEAFAKLGANVVLAGDIADAGQDAARRIQQAGAKAVFVHTDVSDPRQVERLMVQAVAAFGRIDYAVNNAGIEGAQAATADCTEANWARVLAVNLTGAWLCMKHEIPKMLTQGGGAIINVSSVAGLVGFRNLPAYVASKHGLVGLTKTAALEYATRGIRINAVCPGVIHTPMVDRVTGSRPEAAADLIAMEPVGRMGRPEEVADAIVWLAGPHASFVTGHAFAVDGGFLAQ